MAKVQDYINNRHKHKVDQTYQRPPDAWSREDNQCLIDTILRNEPMPLFLFNYKSSDGMFYTVDGQQRLGAILKFFDNEWGLNRKFSGEENHGKKFGGDNPISDEQRENFLNYNLNFKIIENYDDERIRMIFSRLQRGKPLTLGERLNAKPGDIVVRMREIASHPFIKKSIGIAKNRYGHYPDAARIIFYEKYGCKDSGTSAIMSFFEENRSISVIDKDYKNAVYVLNFLARCFPPEPGDYQFFSKHAWVFSVYTMIRELMLGHALNGQEQNIRKFIENFHGKIYSESFRSSNPDYQKFYDNVRGGWSERIIALRRNILIKKFLEIYSVTEKAKRQIDDEEKITCFAKHPECQMCDKKFKDYKEPEYHHKTMYAFGGKSEIDNTMVLCTECHDKIHRAKKIPPPTDENEIIEEENFEEENNESRSLHPLSMFSQAQHHFLSSRSDNLKPNCFSFNGQNYNVKTWKDVLQKLCGVLYELHPENFENKVLSLTGSKNPYFSSNINDLRTPKKINGTNIFIETHMSAGDIRKRCGYILKIFGYEENDFKINFE